MAYSCSCIEKSCINFNKYLFFSTGFKPAPLYRRCSFPVGPNEFNSALSRQDSRRTSIEPRRLSIIDSRRNSIDCRKGSISIDNESPERRHHSRLVHRH